MVEADEHAGLGVHHLAGRQTGVLHGFPRGLQHQTVLRVHGCGFLLRNTEEIRVEVADVVQERAPLAVRAPRNAGFGVVVLVYVPALQWHLGDEVVSAQQCLPELFR